MLETIWETIWEAMWVICLGAFGVTFLHVAARVMTRGVLKAIEKHKKEKDDGQEKTG